MELFAKIKAESVVGCRCDVFIINAEQFQQTFSSVLIFKLSFVTLNMYRSTGLVKGPQLNLSYVDDRAIQRKLLKPPSQVFGRTQFLPFLPWDGGQRISAILRKGPLKTFFWTGSQIGKGWSIFGGGYRSVQSIK